MSSVVKYIIVDDDALSNTLCSLMIRMSLYANFSEEIKNQISIYLVSSSINPRDLNKAKENKYVKGFISKPLDRETILAIEENNF